MSNARRAAAGNTYRTGYLRSPAWFARRDCWFDTEAQRGTPLTCAACGRASAKAQLELHHTDYTGVGQVDGQWRALEAHDDLIPLHAGCHELLHRLLDRDRVLARHRTRRDATRIALARLREKLIGTEVAP